MPTATIKFLSCLAICIAACDIYVFASPGEPLRSKQVNVFKPLETRHAMVTTNQVIQIYGDAVRSKLKPLFEAQKIVYPPSEMTWICLKQEKVLLVYARNQSGRPVLLLRYPIIGASGVAGPKLKEGDKQVPEGFYKVTGLRPNVIAHLALAVDYPNEEDRIHARKENRHSPGGDILIHGSLWSTGCLAMGNAAIDELFVLTHDTGCSKINLIFAPCDLSKKSPDLDMRLQPRWLPGLYARIRAALKLYQIPEIVVRPSEKTDSQK